MAALASPPSSFAAAFASARCRATIVTFAPFLAKTCAMPLPIPLLAPVTTTDFPAIDVSMCPLLGRVLTNSCRVARPCTEYKNRSDGRDRSEHRHSPRRGRAAARRRGRAAAIPHNMIKWTHRCRRIRSQPTPPDCLRPADLRCWSWPRATPLELRVGPVAKPLGDTTVRMLGNNGS